jgi:hypothetical protein
MGVREMKKNNDLKKCSCGEYPSIVKGKHALTEEIKYSIACENPKCPTSPATDRSATLRSVKKAWNLGLITNHLFRDTK